LIITGIDGSLTKHTVGRHTSRRLFDPCFSDFSERVEGRGPEIGRAKSGKRKIKRLRGRERETEGERERETERENEREREGDSERMKVR
jgi:hypothetical protein